MAGIPVQGVDQENHRARPDETGDGIGQNSQFFVESEKDIAADAQGSAPGNPQGVRFHQGVFEHALEQGSGQAQGPAHGQPQNDPGQTDAGDDPVVDGALAVKEDAGDVHDIDPGRARTQGQAGGKNEKENQAQNQQPPLENLPLFHELPPG